MIMKKLRGDPAPINQRVDITGNDTFISFQPLSGYTLVRPEEGSLPEFLAANSGARQLGAALIAALGRCRHVPLDDRAFYSMDTYRRTYQRSEDEIVRRTGCKTKREAYKNMIWCRVIRAEGQIKIRPSKPDTPGTWDPLPEEMCVTIPETTDPDVVGAALALALQWGRTYSG